MRKDNKKTPKTKRPKKADTKDLRVRNPGTVKGGMSFVKKVDKATPDLMS